jgi:hypothetical protein
MLRALCLNTCTQLVRIAEASTQDVAQYHAAIGEAKEAPQTDSRSTEATPAQDVLARHSSDQGSWRTAQSESKFFAIEMSTWIFP